VANFIFDGRNSIYADMINQLPSGLVYLKQQNVIPVLDKIIFVEFYDTYAVGTNVDVYVNNQLHMQTQVKDDKSIYVEMKVPVKKVIEEINGQIVETITGTTFNIVTKIAGQKVTDENFISLNLFAFFVIFAKTFNYDYIETFKLFGNLYFASTQNELLYDKFGWYFDFARNNLDYETYRQIVAGKENIYGLQKSFVYATTIKGLMEFVKSFTGSYPAIFSYKDYIGNFMKDTAVVQIWKKARYFMKDGFDITCLIDTTSLNLNGTTMTLQVGTTRDTINFTATGSANIVNEINAVFTDLASVVVSGVYEYIKLSTAYDAIHILGGTAIELLGFTINQADDLRMTRTERFVFMDEAFRINTIRVLIRQWTLSTSLKTDFERLFKLMLPLNVKAEIIYGDNLWEPLEHE